MSAVDAGQRCRLRPGIPPLRRRAGVQRGAATSALYKASMRRALGIRRSWRQKVAPFVLLGVVTIPAIVNVGIGYVTRDEIFRDRVDIITYREYVGVSAALLLFVALTAPDVVCPDRRQRVLPLLFARPLLGVDYVLAKVGAIATILFAFSFLPQVVLFVGNMFVSDRRARVLHRAPRDPVGGAVAVVLLRCAPRSSAWRSRLSPSDGSSRAPR